MTTLTRRSAIASSLGLAACACLPLATRRALGLDPADSAASDSDASPAPDAPDDERIRAAQAIVADRTSILGPGAPAGATAPGPLAPRPAPRSALEQNPFLPASESMIHNDVYNSDVTSLPVPLGINTEIRLATVQGAPIAPPALFYDEHGNAVTPLTLLTQDGTSVAGGIAIRDMASPTLETRGTYLPAQQEPDAPYGIQISYSFVDADGHLVGPTNTGHVVIFRVIDETGAPLETFEKLLDVDLIGPARSQLGDDVDDELLSIVYDYDGNLWFATGGFHMDPAVSKDGLAGYLERTCIDALLSGQADLDPAAYLHCWRFAQPGENCENGIASHPQGCVILTNRACYLLRAAGSGVEVVWSVPYACDGGKAAVPGSPITGCGLAWGGGSSPSLTNELVIFTDNQDVVNLIAVDIATGEVVTQTPVLDLGPDVIVSVENSVSVYSASPEQTCVLVCNWYGAGSASLFEADADSSVQSFDNLYDATWRKKGSSQLMPGVERVDIVRAPDGTYEARTIWTRADLRDTSMIKLSSGSGYFHGYTQDLSTGQWGFFALDRDTGATQLWIPVSDEPQFNNAAVGVMQDQGGNTLWCPTDSQTMVGVSDRFAFLPALPDESGRLDITAMTRTLADDEAIAAAAPGARALAYELSATASAAQVEALKDAQLPDDPSDASWIAFLVNGLEGRVGDLVPLRRREDGTLAPVVVFSISQSADPLAGGANGAEGAEGAALTADDELDPATLYQAFFRLDEAGVAQPDGSLRVSVQLATTAAADAAAGASEV